VFSEEGLRQHHPSNDAAAARREISQAIVKAGMQAADEGKSSEFFTGRLAKGLAAQDALRGIGWIHHQPQMPDAGTFYFVFPRGAKNVEFVASRLVFNMT
jgi:hypothetical protein